MTKLINANRTRVVSLGLAGGLEFSLREVTNSDVGLWSRWNLVPLIHLELFGPSGTPLSRADMLTLELDTEELTEIKVLFRDYITIGGLSQNFLLMLAPVDTDFHFEFDTKKMRVRIVAGLKHMVDATMEKDPWSDCLLSD